MSNSYLRESVDIFNNLKNSYRQVLVSGIKQTTLLLAVKTLLPRIIIPQMVWFKLSISCMNANDLHPILGAPPERIAHLLSKWHDKFAQVLGDVKFYTVVNFIFYKFGFLAFHYLNSGGILWQLTWGRVQSNQNCP